MSTSILERYRTIRTEANWDLVKLAMVGDLGRNGFLAEVVEMLG